MTLKTRIHDGIVGLMLLTAIVVGAAHDVRWLYAGGGIAALMISSTFTGFCPVYYVLDRLMAPDGLK